MFLMQNYLPVDRDFVRQNYPWHDRELRVAGAFLKPAQPHCRRIDFDVVIPARYEIIAPDGQVTGSLDGTRIRAPGFSSEESILLCRALPHETSFCFGLRLWIGTLHLFTGGICPALASRLLYAFSTYGKLLLA